MGHGPDEPCSISGSRTNLIPTLNDNRSVSVPKGEAARSPWQRRGFDPFKNMKPKGRPMRKPHFRMDRAGECALSGRILFWGRFSQGVAMGWKRSAPCGASDMAKIRAAFLNKAERLIHGVPITNYPENSDTWHELSSTSNARAVGSAVRKHGRLAVRRRTCVLPLMRVPRTLRIPSPDGHPAHAPPSDDSKDAGWARWAAFLCHAADSGMAAGKIRPCAIVAGGS